MSALVSRWILPPAALVTAWIGPDGRVEAAAMARPDAAGVPVVIGPRGPRGLPGTGAVTRIDASLSATWILPHGLGREPQVQVFLANGELVMADVAVDEVQVTVSFSMAQQGFVLVS